MMNIFTRQIVLCSALFLGACTMLPSSGPSYRQVDKLARPSEDVNVSQVEIIDVDNRIAQDLYLSRNRESFTQLGEGYTNPNQLGVGDVVEVTIWEAPPAVLFGGALSAVGSGNAQLTKLPSQMIDPKGQISIPFIGAVSVVGKTPFQVQEIIKGRLKRMANQPQVMVNLVQNNAANVSVVRAGKSVRMPLTSAGERVLDAVSSVGGSTANVQDTTIQLTRGNTVRAIALEELVSNPQQNILLRRGDVVTMITNNYSFTALGAVGRAQEIGFSARGLSLAEAVGRMGGLQDYRADARGVFVFRYTPLVKLPPQEQEKWLSEGYRAGDDIPTVYRVNLNEANALFAMQRFPVENKDVVYVSNAPLAEVQKFLQFVFSPLTRSIYDVDRIVK